MDEDDERPRHLRDFLLHPNGPVEKVNGHRERGLCPNLVRPLASEIATWNDSPGLNETSQLLWEMVRLNGPGFTPELMRNFIKITGPEHWPNNTVGKYVQIHLLRTMRSVFKAPLILTRDAWPFKMSGHVRMAIELLKRDHICSPHAFYQRIMSMLHWFPSSNVSADVLAGLADDYSLQLLLCAFFKTWPFLAVASVELLDRIFATDWTAVHVARKETVSYMPEWDGILSEPDEILLSQFPSLKDDAKAKLKEWKSCSRFASYAESGLDYFRLLVQSLCAGLFCKIPIEHAADVRGVATVHRVLTTERKNIKRTRLCRHLIVCHYLWLPSRMKSYVDLVPNQRSRPKRKRE